MLDAMVGVSARGIAASLRVPAGETLALLGPNGSGKTTVIESLAGLVSPDAGHAILGDAVLFSHEDGHKRMVEPRLRGIALVTQEASLFPHLSVLDNVAFPARARGAGRALSRSSAATWLDRVGAADLGTRRPATLSGGESRRVAVARALASEPRLMLLDEPFASLDVEAATSMRSLLRDVLRGRTCVISTHDGLDAIDLAHSVAVLDAGTVVEYGPTAATFERPRTAFTAAMAGLVWITGTWKEGALALADGQRLEASGDGLGDGVRAAATLDPRSVRVAALDATGAVRDTVVDLEPRGEGTVRVRGSLLWADTSIAQATLGLPRVGEPVLFDVTTRPEAFAL